MKYRLKVYSIWEYGKRKDAEGNPHQEDSTYPLPNHLNNSDRTFILCDGMGGHDAGEVASATVCQAMGNYIINDGHDAEGVFSDDDLNQAIAAAFSALDEKDSGAEKKMGTTMTLLKLHNNGATVAHIGDSRVYHIRPGDNGTDTQILFETEDHSLVNDLIKIGELTREEARHSRQKNVITRAMQPNMERKPKPDIKHITDIKAGDFFYMCSDGMLEQEEMDSGESIKNIFSNAVKSVDDKVKILTEVTKNNRDNHTALIIHIEEVEGDEASVEDKVNDKEADTQLPEVSPIAKGIKNKKDIAGESLSNSNVVKPNAINPRLKIKGYLIIFVTTAIIVAACFVCSNYISSCSKKPNVENNETIFYKETKKDIKQPPVKSDDSKKIEEQANAESLVNPASEQSPSPEVAPSGKSSLPSENANSPISLPSSEDVVTSDREIIQNNFNQHLAK